MKIILSEIKTCQQANYKKNIYSASKKFEKLYQKLKICRFGKFSSRDFVNFFVTTIKNVFTCYRKQKKLFWLKDFNTEIVLCE